MNKHSLANIVYERSLQRQVSQRWTAASTHIKQKNINTTPIDNTEMTDLNPPGSLIKITHFNTRLLNQPTSTLALTYSASPHRQFQIKRVSEGKLRPGVQSYNLVQTELKKREDTRRYRESKGGEETMLQTQQATKIFIASKWNFKSDMAQLDYLTNQINCSQSVVAVRSHQSQKVAGPISPAVMGVIKPIGSVRDTGRNGPMKVRNKDNLKCEPTTGGSRREEGEIVRKMSGSPKKNYNRHIKQQKKYQQNIEKQKREMLESRKELVKNYAKPFTPPQNVSAFSYIVYEADLKKSGKLRKCSAHRYETQQLAQIRKLFLHSHQVVVSLNSRTSVQIASLTKIMTCILAIDLANQYSVNLEQEMVTIGLFEQNIGGTSAGIKKGQIYSLKQLLYGLMLPSGNDASVAIAVWGGRLLLRGQATRQHQRFKSVSGAEDGYNGQCFKKRQSYQRFICEMNNKAANLNMQKTKYSNSHGLSTPQNRSCSYDLCVLCEYSMNNPIFREIVSRRVFQTQIQIQSHSPPASKCTTRQPSLRESQRSLKDRISLGNISIDPNQTRLEQEQMKDMDEVVEGYLAEEEEVDSHRNSETLCRTVRWENTHQLVQDKGDLYTGIKTGVTGTAGPCLASAVEIKGRRFIIVVLNCKNMKLRMKDTQILRKWLFAKESIKYSEKLVIQQQLTC